MRACLHAVGSGSMTRRRHWRGGGVPRSRHNQGIGAKLRDYRLSLIKQRLNVSLIKIDTSQHTAGFYAKQGFATSNVIKDRFGEGIDCVQMELAVAG